MDDNKIDIGDYLCGIGKNETYNFLLDKFDEFSLYTDYYYRHLESEIFFETNDY